jgi:hypothetical protein
LNIKINFKLIVFHIQTATLVRNLDGSHALHRVSAAQQPQLVRIDGSDQTFEVTPFGLRNLGGGFGQPLVNAHFIQA